MTSPLTPQPPIDQPYYGAPFGAAFVRFWKKGITFTGRASRSEFWHAYIATQGLCVVLYLLSLLFAALATAAVFSAYSSSSSGAMPSDPTAALGGAAALGNVASAALWGSLLWGLATIVPSLALTWRRLHDTDKSGVFFFLAFIPFAGSIVYFVLVSLPSAPAGVRFDEGMQSGAYAPSGSAAPVNTPAADAHAIPTAGDGFAASTPMVPVPMPSGAPYVPPVPQPAGIMSVPSGFPPVPAPSAAVTAPAFDAQQGSVPPVPAPTPMAGPIQAIPGVASAAPAQATPAPAQAASVPAQPATSAPAYADDLDSTRISPAPQGQWQAQLSDGRQIRIGSSVRVGRDPAADAADPHAVLVPIDDPAKTISKTHAQLCVDGAELLVTDLHSTNGTIVRTAGTPVMLAPATPYRVAGDAEVQVGDYLIRVRRG